MVPEWFPTRVNPKRSVTLRHGSIATVINYLSLFNSNDTFICYTIFLKIKTTKVIVIGPVGFYWRFPWTYLVISLERSLSFFNDIRDMNNFRMRPWYFGIIPTAVEKSLPCQPWVDPTASRKTGRLTTFVLCHWWRISSPEPLDCGPWV